MHSPKYKQIKDELAVAIANGEYSVGMQLPSYRQLAEQWNVSYVTVSKALTQLAAENYIDLNQGQGAFVRWRREGAYPTNRHVRVFILPYTHPSLATFRDVLTREMEALSWRVEFIVTNSMAEMIELVRDPSAYSVTFGFMLSRYDDIAALCAAGRERLVVVGERLDRFGITSSCVDSSQVIRVAMRPFLSAGKTRVALVCTNLRHPDEMEYAAVWRNLYESANPAGPEPEDCLIDLKLEQFGAVREKLLARLERLRRRGSLEHWDGIISTDDEKAVIIAGYLHDHGIPMPGKIGLIAVNESNLAQMVRPRLTTIDTHLEEQTRKAAALLEAKVTGRYDHLPLRLTEPSLRQRESTL